jgi:LCP family protein required for cell wall assembly
VTPRPPWRWRGFATRFATALTLITVATVALLSYAFWFANDQLTNGTRKAPIDEGVLAADTGPANYLIVGSDSRAFVHDAVAADKFGSAKDYPETLADVIMIAHVDPKAPGKGFLVSIPRDTWVPIAGHGMQKINAAFNYGNGPTTLIRTIQDNFHFDINHYLKLDFVTFTDVVGAIGKVHIFFPAAARDTFTGLHQDAGCQALDGLEALAYARSRHYLSKTARGYTEDPRADLGRIERQQYFIRSLTQEAIKKGARNPLTAKAIVEEIVPHLEVDRHMGLRQFLTLVRAFRNVDPGGLQMMTVPTKTVDVDGVSTQQLKPDAAPIFALLRNFSASKRAAVPKIAHAKIRVQMLNGSAVKGVASTAAEALHAAGFASGGAAADADQPDYRYTQVRYTPGNLDKAAVVASYLGGVGLLTKIAPTATNADVVVVLGHDFVAVTAPGSKPRAGTASATTVAPNPGTTPGLRVPAADAGRPAVGCG